MLSDGETVVALDFTLENVQRYIEELGEAGNRDALIVSEQGQILGYKDTSLTGANVGEVLPEYLDVIGSC